MWVDFFLHVAMGAALTLQMCIIRSHYINKPPGRQSLLDLINADFALLYALLSDLMFSILGLHSLDVEVNEAVAHAMAWATQFMTQVVYLYFSAGIASRCAHLYAFSATVWEGVTDAQAIAYLRVATAWISLLLCWGLLVVSGVTLDWYAFLMHVPETDHANTYVILGMQILSLVLNLTLGVLLAGRKKEAKYGEGALFFFKVMTSVSVIVTIVVYLVTPGSVEEKLNGVTNPALMTVSVLSPSLIIVCKRPLRKKVLGWLAASVSDIRSAANAMMNAVRRPMQVGPEEH